jgi:hypothetical protein
MTDPDAPVRYWPTLHPRIPISRSPYAVPYRLTAKAEAALGQHEPSTKEDAMKPTVRDLTAAVERTKATIRDPQSDQKAVQRAADAEQETVKAYLESEHETAVGEREAAQREAEAG